MNIEQLPDKLSDLIRVAADDLNSASTDGPFDIKLDGLDGKTISKLLSLNFVRNGDIGNAIVLLHASRAFLPIRPPPPQENIEDFTTWLLVVADKLESAGL